MDLIDYINLGSRPIQTNESLISNWNLLFVKIINYIFTYWLLWAVSPVFETERIASCLHIIGSCMFIIVSTLDLTLICLIWPDRTCNNFNPVQIIMTTISTPFMMIIDMGIVCLSPIKFGKQLGVFGLCLYLVHYQLRPTIPWFLSTLFLDVWIFFAFFLIRKINWLKENLNEKRQIVAYFQGTYWGRITKNSAHELIYCMTTGVCNNFAIQLGKFVILLAAQKFCPSLLGPQGWIQSLYVASVIYTILFYNGITKSTICYLGALREINEWFVRHHKFYHYSASQYITKHFDHHDVLPLASAGGTGFQENLYRSLTLILYGPQCGYNILTYLYSTTDEFQHNFCPTASRSEVLQKKPIHLQHHMGHTIPLGFMYSYETKENNFQYDKKLWDRIKPFVPELQDDTTPLKKTHFKLP